MDRQRQIFHLINTAMTDYYLDIETVPLEQHKSEFDSAIKNKAIDPSKNKIITIQFQPIWSDSGRPKGDLTILKEWESDEESIVKSFAEVMFPKDFPSEKIHWAFVPIGNNLMYEFKFLIPRLKQHCRIDVDIFEKPFLDLKHTLIVMNNGKFAGYSALIGKVGEASNMTDWYYSKQHDKITDYIQREAKGFINNYQIIMREIPNIRDKLNPNT